MTCCVDRPDPSLLSPFDPAPFDPRVECGNWDGWLIGAWVVPSIGLLALYWAIAIIILVTWHKARVKTYPREYLPWISAFFVGCGGGHAMNALAFVWPAYVSFILWDWWTFAMSAVGAVGVFRIYKWSRRTIDRLEVRVEEVQHDKEEKEAEVRRTKAQLEERESEAWQEIERRARMNRDLGEKLEGLKTYLESRLHQELTDHDYREMRRRLHDIRGTL